jgi:excisionase family DNA binding protein
VIYLLHFSPMTDVEPEQLQLEEILAEPAPRERDAGHADERRQSETDPPVAPSRPQSEPPPSSALLTTQETADLLHVHPRTIQRLVERGQLSAVHLGAAVRFDPADVSDLTTRLKRRNAGARPTTDIVTPARGNRASFAERLRSQQHEHRAAQA